jgi:hypothetical protein
MHRIHWLLLILGLVVLAVARSVLGTSRDGPTADEPWHAVAGVEYHRTGYGGGMVSAHPGGLTRAATTIRRSRRR